MAKVEAPDQEEATGGKPDRRKAVVFDERSDQERQAERDVLVNKAIELMWGSAVDLGQTGWRVALDDSAREFQDFSPKERGRARKDALGWISSNEANLSGDIHVHQLPVVEPGSKGGAAELPEGFEAMPAFVEFTDSSPNSPLKLDLGDGLYVEIAMSKQNYGGAGIGLAHFDFTVNDHTFRITLSNASGLTGNRAQHGGSNRFANGATYEMGMLALAKSGSGYAVIDLGNLLPSNPSKLCMLVDMRQTQSGDLMAQSVRILKIPKDVEDIKSWVNQLPAVARSQVVEPATRSSDSVSLTLNADMPGWRQEPTEQPVQSEFSAKVVAKLIADQTFIPELDRTNVTEANIATLAFHASKGLVSDPDGLMQAFTSQLRINQKPFFDLRDRLYGPVATRAQLEAALMATNPWYAVRGDEWLGANALYQIGTVARNNQLEVELNTRVVDLLVEINKILAERQKSKVGKPNKAKELLRTVQQWGASILRNAQGAPETTSPAEAEPAVVEGGASALESARVSPETTAAPTPRQRFESWWNRHNLSQAGRVLRTAPGRWRQQIFRLGLNDWSPRPDLTSVHYDDAKEGDVVTVRTNTSPLKLIKERLNKIREQTGDYVSAVDEIEDLLDDPKGYGLDTKKGRSQAWGVVEDAFVEIRATSPDKVGVVTKRVAAQFAALMDCGVMPPESETERLSFSEAFSRLRGFYESHKDVGQVDVQEARRVLFTFWASIKEAPLPDDDDQAYRQVEEYNNLLAFAVGYWAQAGWLEQK